MKPIKPDVANLSVTTHGSVFWNDERMGDEQLAQRLQAPIANSDTRERLRSVLGTPADLPALRTQHRLHGPGSQERLRHIAWPPALAWQQQALAISIQCPAVCAGQLRACRRRACSRQA